MQRRLGLSLMTAIAVVAFSTFAFAHHGNAAYDTTTLKTVTGTVIDFKFVNPHVLISVEVKDPATGKTEKWDGELTSPNHLERAGWTKNTFKIGDEITMSGMALRSGAPAMAIRKIVKNGAEVPTGAGDN
jgi:hypothetical protein